MDRFFLCTLVAVCMLGITGHAFCKNAPLNPATASAAQGLFANSHAPGMVIAIVDGRTSWIKGYGQTQPDSGKAPDAHSLVRLDSLSKLLTADLMVRLAGENKLELTDSLRRYAPAGYRLPTPTSRPITLLDLATHTSGLPRQADFAYKPQESYTAARWQWLETQRALPAPGHLAVYSNIAFDLLSDALSHAAGMPYERALASLITRPLGMSDTTDAPTPEQCQRFISGKSPTPCIPFKQIAGSGGIYSTAADMTLWMKQQLGIGRTYSDPDVTMSQAVYIQRQTLATVEGMDLGGHADGLGLGWVWLAPTEGRPGILEKTGGGYGFMTYMALLPGRQVGIFVAASAFRMADLQVLAQHVNELASRLANDSQEQR